MKNYLLLSIIVLGLVVGCQPAGQQLDTSTKGADPGKESKTIDQQSGNSSNGPTKASTD